MQRSKIFTLAACCVMLPVVIGGALLTGCAGAKTSGISAPEVSDTNAEVQGGDNPITTIIDTHLLLELESLAEIYLWSNSPEDGFALFNAILRMEPDNSGAYNNRGILYHDLGQYDKCADDFERAIELDPKVGAYHYNRGLLYAIMGDNVNAARYYKRSREHDSRTIAASFRESIRYYNGVISRDPENALAHYHRGIVYMGLNDFERAVADFEAALRLDPNHEPAKRRRDEAALKLRTDNEGEEE